MNAVLTRLVLTTGPAGVVYSDIYYSMGFLFIYIFIYCSKGLAVRSHCWTEGQPSILDTSHDYG